MQFSNTYTQVCLSIYFNTNIYLFLYIESVLKNQKWETEHAIDKFIRAGQSRISTSLICPARIAGIGRMSRIEPIDLKYLHDIQKNINLFLTTMYI